MRKKALLVFLFGIAFFAGATDNDGLSVVKNPADPTNSLNEFHIEGFIPDFLKISLDFTPDTHALLVGYYPSKAAAIQEMAATTGSPASLPPQPGREFSINPAKTINLGTALLISNVTGPYAISVCSAHNGTLVSLWPEISATIPYRLSLGEQSAQSQGGVFTFTGSGKSKKGGTRLTLSLVFDELKPPLPHGVYIDELSFTVAAR